MSFYILESSLGNASTVLQLCIGFGVTSRIMGLALFARDVHICASAGLACLIHELYLSRGEVKHAETMKSLDLRASLCLGKQCHPVSRQME